jgi:hypothetical protein
MNDSPESEESPAAKGRFRRFGRMVLRWAVQPAISASLLAFAIWRASPEKLSNTFAALDYQWLIPWTTLMIAGLFVWDTVCLRFVFAQGHPTLSFITVLRARGASYLLGAFNYELGQGVFAWEIARGTGTSVLAALTRAALVMYHDVLVLLALGLIGSLLTVGDAAETARLICLILLAGLASVALFMAFMPSPWRARLLRTQWASWVAFWSWGKTVALIALRSVYFGFIIAYAAVGFSLCELPLDLSTVMSTIPLVLLFDGLPISVSGLGTREAALLLLLSHVDPARVVAYSMMWSGGLVVGRLLIGIVCWSLAKMQP